ncbi:hypothetical protein [Robiginitalea marina]|uniref:Uncharacterized protein n=1 Tax=Robiginitalea marina TaxID=2954105 RepID=A0ABT1B1G4_9FLAO|nr:hypothetical protein [Robiginitalea marina]MCO5725752.1 hypothetical protein [Robiginitalea marina]
MILWTGCKGETGKEDPGQMQAETSDSAPDLAPTANPYTGTYVTDSYAQRGEGYDWVGIRVKEAGDGQFWISVRSRADMKNPTCTFDGMVFPEDEDTYFTVLEGKKVLFDFSNGTLTIRPETGDGNQVLWFRCSGGATLAGTYSKIDGDLDPGQVDPTTFMKYLTLQDISFNVSAVEKEGKQEVTIRSIGLEISDKDPIIMSAPGEILDAGIEDLNSDGYPEVVVFSRHGNRGNVQGISVNSGKSMSRFHFPPQENNPGLMEGVNGKDEFALVETNLVQRFPIEGGKTRQVVYELVEGENGRVFKVRDIQEY